MLRNYFKIALRNLLKHKSFSAINILGLAIGLTIAVLILLWVKFEFSYDNTHVNKDRIYRLGQTQFYTSGPLKVFAMPGPLSEKLKADFPEVEESFRYIFNYKTIRFEDKKFNEEIVYVDKGLFSIFSIDFIQGSAEGALDDLNSIVISDKMALKYFGTTDAIGKILILDDIKSFKVSAVFKELPINSSFRCNFCIPFEHVKEIGFDYTTYNTNWNSIYLLLSKGTSMETFGAKIKDYLKIARNDPEQTNILWLWPLNKMHLYSPNGNGLITAIRLFIVIAFFILIIACINFMNLATARSTIRSREIGLRKVLGAQRKNIITQFIGESIFTTILATIAALLMVQLILPVFNHIADQELTFSFSDFEIIGYIVVLIIFTGLIAGSYPALYLSSFRPIIILKGMVIKGKSGAIFRKSLVVFQFSLSIILIIGSIIIYNQQKYLLKKDIGIERENVIIIGMQGEVNNKYNTFKPLLLQNPNISSVSRASHLPISIGSNTGGMTWEGREDEDDILIGFTFVDLDYQEALGMKMVEGRFYSKEFGTDSATIVLNENAAKVMGLINPIGKWLEWGQNGRYKIVGIVKDFNFKHLSQDVSPMAIFYYTGQCRYLFIKANNDNIAEITRDIENIWNKVFPTYPFEYSMLDDKYKEMYAREEKTSSLFKYFTFLAIIISCLGLFGLASYMAEQKTKEIGIRKVLGSSETKIVYNMTLEFIKWVIIANLIAWPVSWYLGKQFLDQYAYRTGLSIIIFLFSGIISVIIAILTISYQSYRAARANPINALRHE